MAASSGTNNVGEDGSWPKWAIALAIGAPVAVGLAGAYYYTKKKTGVSERKDPEGRTDENVVTESKPPELSPAEKAQSEKNKGNKYFKGGKYDQAIKCYSTAIDICPEENTKDLSTFYQNRAAAYEQLKNYKEVIEDCTCALKLNKQYTKALFRRAKAYEKMGEKMKCLEDVTATCILEGFQNQNSMLLADKVLKDMGKEKAKKKYSTRTPSMPSKQFIKSYFSSFAQDITTQPLESLPVEKTKSIDKVDIEKDAQDVELVEDVKNETDGEDEKVEGDNDDEDKDKDESVETPKSSGYRKAREYFDNEDYDKIIDECTKEIDSEGPCMAHAVLMRATFYMLKGQANLGKPGLDDVIDMESADKMLRVNALIKRGSMYMQQGNSTEALNDFAQAVRIDPENADIYHHRGQLNVLLDRVDEALKDFEKCVSLNPGFALAQAQHCYAMYRAAFAQRSPMQLQAAMNAFEKVIKDFPNCAEGYALFAQALNDQQQYSQADEMFLKAMKLEPENPTTYVHRGLLMLQWKQDVDTAVKLMKKSLEIDDKCDFAYETLGTIEVQRGNLEHAIQLFEKAIDLARTEMEMAHLYSLLDAAIAQTRVATMYNIRPPMQ
ncbi:mitochondrial import receptor subunit TOM70-like [Saccoglossus kowalevskii]|uniref:Mitochondrial import receptor subunit TOM70-like n=1 Tax=Saccoglossus kowalevskii TaxID=10224 RepID=A0ABM0MTG4_SACKO|nr:PREDICTED: mitochondrial import receptor subunit TOM70-like [Saccoglossus kowalevskii]